MEIRVSNVSKNYYSEGKKIEALADVDLTIPSNRIFTLLGPSGCGKTTLLRCIVGLEIARFGGDRHRRRGRLLGRAGHLRSA